MWGRWQPEEPLNKILASLFPFAAVHLSAIISALICMCILILNFRYVNKCYFWFLPHKFTFIQIPNPFSSCLTLWSVSPISDFLLIWSNDTMWLLLITSSLRRYGIHPLLCGCLTASTQLKFWKFRSTLRLRSYFRSRFIGNVHRYFGAQRSYAHARRSLNLKEIKSNVHQNELQNITGHKKTSVLMIIHGQCCKCMCISVCLLPIALNLFSEIRTLRFKSLCDWLQVKWEA